MKNAWLVILLFVACVGNSQSWVEFERLAPASPELQLKGILSKPEGSGPFPAAVMLCGCGGLNDPRDAKQLATWAQRLTGWGYVCLQVDSFGPRGFDKGICGFLGALDDRQRSYDAYAAKAFLARQEFVDPERMAVIGWSHGGWTVMRLADAGRRDPALPPFQAAIAFYPWCEGMQELGAPLLILAGAKDEICPPSRCEALADFAGVKNSPHEFLIKLYPDTYHSFDQEGSEGQMSGKGFGYNQAATEDSIVRVRDFLARHLKTDE